MKSTTPEMTDAEFLRHVAGSIGYEFGQDDKFIPHLNAIAEVLDSLGDLVPRSRLRAVEQELTEAKEQLEVVRQNARAEFVRLEHLAAPVPELREALATMLRLTRRHLEDRDVSESDWAAGRNPYQEAIEKAESALAKVPH